MQDPHVVSLTYRFAAESGRTYVNPMPVFISQPEFTGTLDSGRFVAVMARHYAVPDDARQVVDAYLRAWQIAASLKEGHYIAFEFADAKVIDRTPPPVGTVIGHGQVMLPHFTLDASCHSEICSFQYPAPPVNFAATPTVEILWARYDQWRNGKEPIYSMAYFCETALHAAADCQRRAKRQGAAKKFDIDKNLLGKLGELSSCRGGNLEGRKGDTLMATAAEYNWLTAAIPAIILHIGAVESGKARGTLSMSDLPPL